LPFLILLFFGSLNSAICSFLSAGTR